MLFIDKSQKEIISELKKKISDIQENKKKITKKTKKSDKLSQNNTHQSYYTPKTHEKIYQKYKEAMYELSPYDFVMDKDIKRFGFLSADKIAQKMNIDKNDNKRISVGLFYVLMNILSTQPNIEVCLTDLIRECQKNNIGDEPYIIDYIINNDNIYSINNENYVYLNKHKRWLNYCLNYCVYVANYPSLLNNININLNNTLTYEQQQAIINALKYRVSLVYGPAGSGKTHIMVELCKIISSVYGADSILLCAFTGRAAQNMKDRLPDDLKTIIECKTIHKAIKKNPYQYQPTNYKITSKKIIIVDECSMLTLDLFYDFLKTIYNNNNTPHVVLLGDNHQLPPIGIGQIFKYLLDLNIKKTELKYVHRQQQNSGILQLANMAISNYVPKYKEISQLNNVNLNILYAPKSPTDFLSLLVNRIKKYINNGYNIYNDILVLTSFKKGAYGTDVLNKTIRQSIYPTNEYDQNVVGEHTFYIRDKIMQVVNNYDRGVMNGEIGIIKNITSDKITVYFHNLNMESDYTYLQAKKEIIVSFANTIHKSQGGEYPIVILLLHASHYVLLNKNMFYTAISRAKNNLEIISDKKSVLISLYK